MPVAGILEGIRYSRIRLDLFVATRFLMFDIRRHRTIDSSLVCMHYHIHSMRSSHNCTPLKKFHDNVHRQRRRRKEEQEHLSLSRCSPQNRRMIFISSVWICLNYYMCHVESGYVPVWGRPMRHSSIKSLDFSRQLISNDRSKDPESSDEPNTGNADRLLRSMGEFVPFFASQELPPSPEPSDNKDKSSSGFWGAGEWFRRDSEGKTNDTPSSKKRDRKGLPKNPKTATTATTNRKNDIKTPQSSNPLTKLQDLFSFNSTKSPDEKDNSKSIRPNIDRRNSNNNTSMNNNNPLSVFQKFLTAAPSLLFKGTTPEETWIPVFPKTRIMPGEMVPVAVAGIDLLVIASIDGRSLYCIANSCPHLGTPLETGRLTRLPIESKTSSTSPLPTDETATAVTTDDSKSGILFSETDISNILSQDGCEDCIVCPLHRTAFALNSGEVRGEWCPYPPVIGALMGTVKEPTSAAVFQVRTRGKNIEVRLNNALPVRE